MSMRYVFFSVLTMLAMLVMLCIGSNVSAAEPYIWPHGAKAAVSLSYDDALNSQLDNAVPALDYYGFKGSFYLTLTSPTFTQRKNEWQTIANNGHELGNHTIYHACRGSLPNRSWVNAENDLDHKTLIEIKNEILKANDILTAVDGQSIRTFTLPCTDNIVAGKDLLPEIARYFIGMKTHVGEIPRSMKAFDPKNTPVWAPNGNSAEELINYVKLAAKNNSIANLTFHGIGGDHLSTSTAAHQQLLAYLAENKEMYWVDTYRNISLYLQDH